MFYIDLVARAGGRYVPGNEKMIMAAKFVAFVKELWFLASQVHVFYIDSLARAVGRHARAKEICLCMQSVFAFVMSNYVVRCFVSCCVSQ